MATINLTEREIRAMLQAVSTRLNGIRGYCLSEEDYLTSAKEKLQKSLEE
jgi:CHASE3 domain sensor protein